ncbi:hypothetical protein EIP86_007407 [Pleurotus ostreatoroseus]|nr:hypothetical protein EIP86_007407 [Pleurotus ostreatoroseus]
MKLALISLISLCVLLGYTTASPVLGEARFISRDDLEDDSVNIISSYGKVPQLERREEEETDSFNLFSHYNTVPPSEDDSVDVISRDDRVQARDDTVDKINISPNY